MKTRLIDIKTNEQYLCDKITIDWFDYYVSNKFIEEGDFAVNLNTKQITQCDGVKGMDSYWKKAVATNNSSISIPQVVDKVDQYTMAQNYAIETKSPNREAHRQGFVKGYNKSQETHPFSEEDMIEFALYVATAPNAPYKTAKELLQLFKEQQPKTVYYNANN